MLSLSLSRFNFKNLKCEGFVGIDFETPKTPWPKHSHPQRKPGSSNPVCPALFFIFKILFHKLPFLKT